MFVRESLYENLVELVNADDSAGLNFFLRWERDRRSYLNHRNKDGLTLLHQACLLGKLRVVRSLVECGCDVEGRSSVGWTALHAGALSGNYEVVSFLVNACASNVVAVDDMGCKPIDLTLEPQITSLLQTRTDEQSKRAAEEARTFQEISARMCSVVLNEKKRSYSVPVTFNRNRSENCIRVNSDSYFLQYVRFREDDADIVSLPGDIGAKHRGKRNKTTGVGKTKERTSERDSGIYEDLPDIRDLTMKNHPSDKPEKYFAARRSRHSIV